MSEIRLPDGTRMQIRGDQRLIGAFAGTNPGFTAYCGGTGECGKCKVKVHGELSPPSEIELRRLTVQELGSGVRLACQTTVLGEAFIEGPPGSASPRFSTPTPDWAFCGDPWISVRPVSVDMASRHGRNSEWERIVVGAGLPPGTAPGPWLARRVGEIAEGRTEQGAPARLDLVLCSNEVLDILPEGRAGVYGLAIDTGTTALVVYLVNLQSGRVIGVEAGLNPQCACGADIVSRMAYAATPGGLEELNRSLLAAVNRLAAKLSARHGVDAAQIYGAVAVGNPCMQHLFLGVSPASLAVLPHVPAVRQCGPFRAREAGLDIHENALVDFLPGVAGFVGSDLIAAALACGLTEGDPPTLLIDAGTNGEVLLAGRGRMLACSTAAGPAFEGATISCGMIACDGAIDRFRVTDSPVGPDLEHHVIGGGPARGICGSGLLSLVSGLRRIGVLDASGRMSRPAGSAGERVIEGADGLHYRIAAGETGGDLTVTQRDIREFQLAKAALRAGVETLLREAGLKASEIQRIFLAGGFGAGLDAEAAFHTGMLPPAPNALGVPVGHAAGEGAVLALVSEEVHLEAVRLADRVEHVNLTAHMGFTDLLAASMALQAN